MGYPDLLAMSGQKNGHEYYYQVPDSPNAVVMFFHGCVGSGSNYWPQSDSCPECRGLPEQMSHTLQALRRNYAGQVVPAQSAGAVLQSAVLVDCLRPPSKLLC